MVTARSDRHSSTIVKRSGVASLRDGIGPAEITGGLADDVKKISRRGNRRHVVDRGLLPIGPGSDPTHDIA